MNGISEAAPPSNSRGPRLVFVRCTAADDNIGDVVLRRRLLDELRPIGQLHILMGDCGESFIEALALGPDDKVYSDKTVWRAARQRAANAGPILYVAKPGEVHIQPGNVAGAFRELPKFRQITRNGGLVVQLGMGGRVFPPFLTKLLGFTFRYHRLLAWRDTDSPTHFGFGETMPDWGFDDAGPSRKELPDEGARDLLALSLRGDRPYPGTDWIASVRAFAAETGLKPIVVTQVRRDSEGGRRLAQDLGAEFADWTTESHTEQEERLRRIYRRTRLAISDRLHVLILAFTELAIPICLLDRPESKVGRHFDAVGYRKSSVNVAGFDLEARRGLLREALGREDEVAAARLLARSQIRYVCGQLQSIVATEWEGGKGIARAPAEQPARA